MAVILRLTWRYMKQNRRRTIITTLGIALAVCALTAVVVFTSSFTRISREMVIKDEGGWHVRFHQVTEAQAKELAEWKKAKKSSPTKDCGEHAGELCMDVEMRRPGIGTLAAAQKYAKEIGMEELPKGEWSELSDHTTAKYEVSYHDELLQYYGVFSMGPEGVGALSVNILVVIILLSSVFIYNAFAVSAFEKMRYIGMLGSVGATRLQKSACILLEGALEGIAGTILGIATGRSITGKVIEVAVRALSASENVAVVLGIKELLIILGCSALIILASCTIPSSRAANATVIDLLIRPYPPKLDGQRITSLKREHKIIGVEGAIALKNIFLKEKQYSACIGILSLSLCILLSGTVALKIRAGDYYVKDLRERPETAMWTELDCSGGKMQEFYERLKGLKEVQSISLQRALDFSGILVDEADTVSKDFSEMQVKDENGRVEGGNLAEVTIIGLDERTFSDYAQKAGIDQERDDGESGYPVILEDYMLGMEISEKDGQEKDVRYEYSSHLKKMDHENFNFVYSKYGDMYNWGMNYDSAKNQFEIAKLLDGSFYVLGTTKETPPYPSCKEYMDDTEENNGFYGSSRLKAYMKMEDFERFLEDPAYQDTYGSHPKEAAVSGNDEPKKISACMTFDIARESSGKKWSKGDVQYLHKDVKMRAREDRAFQPKVSQAAKDSGISGKEYIFGSAAVYELEKSQWSQGSIVQILGYGAIALIVAFSLTSILQKISTSTRTRRKEFAMLLSMGMTKKSLKKMIVMENSIYGLMTGILGIPFSIFLMHTQFSEYAGIVKKVPYHLIAMEFVIVMLLTVFPAIYGIRQLRTVKIIDGIHDEAC